MKFTQSIILSATIHLLIAGIAFYLLQESGLKSGLKERQRTFVQILPPPPLPSKKQVQRGQSKNDGKNNRPSVQNPLNAQGLSVLRSPGLKALGVPLFQNSNGAKEAEEYAAYSRTHEETILDDESVKYHTFMKRSYDALYNSWIPILREKLKHYYLEGGRLAPGRNYQVKVELVLDEEGKLLHIYLFEESGTRELDQAAYQAINRVNQFHNPPKALLDSNRQIRILGSFTLYN